MHKMQPNFETASTCKELRNDPPHDKTGPKQQNPYFPMTLSQWPKARAMGMDVSLFSHLQTPENTVALSLQYRMNKEIQDVANYMTYDGTGK